MTKMRKDQERGFTIVELLIATAVLSTLLVVVSVMMANIGRLYYKGINQAKMQENVRSVVDEISDRLQLNNSSVGRYNTVDPVKAYCIGTTRYTYILGQQLSSTHKHVLWRDTIGAGTCTKADLNADNPSITTGGSNGSELITTRSRLSQFSIIPTDSPYVVTMKLVYGDDDQLADPNNDGIPFTGPDVSCLSQSGNQFCATAALTTTVVQRTTGSN